VQSAGSNGSRDDLNISSHSSRLGRWLICAAVGVGHHLFIHMKSALLTAIFAITGGVAIMLAVPAGEKVAVVKIHPPKWAEDAPLVPQIEEEDLVVPEPLEHYSVAQVKAKIEKQAPRRHRHVARRRTNFFEKLVIGFMNLQKHQLAKSSRKRLRTTSARG
jgi:hypothetical protein